MPIIARQDFSLIASQTFDGKEVAAEVDFIASGGYGLEQSMLAFSKTTVIFGSGVGYIPYYLCNSAGHSDIICVDPDEKRQFQVTSLLNRLGISTLRYLSEDELKLEIEQNPGRFGTLVFMPNTYTPERIGLFDPCDLTYLSGVVDSHLVNPVRLYRRSASLAATFCWHDLKGGIAVADRRHDGPEISIVVPAYKVEEYLPQCIESLVNQTIQSKEIIIVDDGSPDGTGALADRLADANPCVRVVHKSNGGCASARQAGLEAATGRFVAFVDSDDWCELEMFETLFGAAAVYGADVAHCGFQKVHSYSGEVERFDALPPLGHEAWFGGVARNPVDFASSYPAIWARLHRRSFLIDNGIRFPAHIKRFDDLPFQFEVFSRAKRAAFVRGIYYNYRIGRPGQDVAIRDRRLFVHFPIFGLLYNVVLGVGDYTTERQFKLAQFNSHDWTQQIIDPELRDEYMRGAAKDLFERRGSMSIPLLFKEMWRLKRPKFRLFLRWYWLWLRSKPSAAFPAE